MDNPATIHTTGKQPHTLSSSGSFGRQSSTDSHSSEFEFCRVRNPSQSPTILSADELFHDGVLLPLNLLSLKSSDRPDPDLQNLPHSSIFSDPPDPSLQTPPLSSLSSDPPAPPDTGTEPGPWVGSGPELTHESATSGLTASKRWRQIFKRSEGKAPTKSQEERAKGNKKRQKERQIGPGSGSGSAAAELNINIWPFSRSRSARNSVTRSRFSFTTTRKVSSAPCSRSNSSGGSKSIKWPSSPGRAGVHLGRSSPVWQVHRGKRSESTVRSVVGGVFGKKITGTRRDKKVNTGDYDNYKAEVLNLNVPLCSGYRSPLSCGTDKSGNGSSGSGNTTDGGGRSLRVLEHFGTFENVFM